MQNSSSKCSDFNPTCRNLYTPTILNPAPLFQPQFPPIDPRAGTHSPVHHHPPFRRISAWYLRTKAAVELSFVGNPQAQEAAHKASRDAYLEGRANTWGCFVTSMARCPESGLGGTEQSVADALEVHRCVINVATNHGSLGSALLIDLMSNPFVLSQTFIHNADLRRRMGQDGFIRTAKLKALSHGIDQAMVTDLDVLSYEILCRDIKIRSEDDWNRPLSGPEIEAVVSSVVDPAARIVPDWFSRKRRTAAKLLRSQLADRNFAADYIRALEDRWIPTFVETFLAVEGIGCDDLWDRE